MRIISISIIFISTLLSIIILTSNFTWAGKGLNAIVFSPRVAFGGIVNSPVCDCDCSEPEGMTLIEIGPPSDDIWPNQRTGLYMITSETEFYEHADGIGDLYDKWSLGMAVDQPIPCLENVGPFCRLCGMGYPIEYIGADRYYHFQY